MWVVLTTHNNFKPFYSILFFKNDSTLILQSHGACDMHVVYGVYTGLFQIAGELKGTASIRHYQIRVPNWKKFNLLWFSTFVQWLRVCVWTPKTVVETFIEKSFERGSLKLFTEVVEERVIIAWLLPQEEISGLILGLKMVWAKLILPTLTIFSEIVTKFNIVDKYVPKLQIFMTSVSSQCFFNRFLPNRHHRVQKTITHFPFHVCFGLWLLSVQFVSWFGAQIRGLLLSDNFKLSCLFLYSHVTEIEKI